MVAAKESIPNPSVTARAASEVFSLEQETKNLALAASNARIYGLIKGPDLGMGGKQICTIDVNVAGRKMKGPLGNTVNTEKALVAIDQWGTHRLFRYGHEKGSPIIEEVPWERLVSHPEAQVALARIKAATSKQLERIQDIIAKEEARIKVSRQKLTKVVEGTDITGQEAARRWGVDLKAVRQAEALLKAVLNPVLKRIRLAAMQRPIIKDVVTYGIERVRAVKEGVDLVVQAGGETIEMTRQAARKTAEKTTELKEATTRAMSDVPGKARALITETQDMVGEIREGVKEARSNPVYSKSEVSAMAKAAIEQRERRQEDLERGVKVSQVAKAMHESFVSTVPVKPEVKSVSEIATGIVTSEKQRWQEKMQQLESLSQEFAGPGWAYLQASEPAEGLGKRIADVSVRLLVEQDLLPVETNATNAWLTIRPNGRFSLVSAQIKWGSLMKLAGRAPTVGEIKQVALTPEIAEALGDEVLNRTEASLVGFLAEANLALDKRLTRAEERPNRGIMATAGLAMREIKDNIRRRIQAKSAKPSGRGAIS